MKIMFDVGANYGTDSVDFIEKNAEWVCFAFEPTPHLINHLKQKTASFSSRYHIIPCAVSDFDGEANFHIAGQADWGCSSLLKFSEDTNKTWPGRNDFKVTEIINVRVITLKTFIENMSPIPISQIDRFHCDTQGSDLKVLKGMGDYISLIKEGVVEAANKTDILYKNQNTVADTTVFLLQKDFKTHTIINDIFENEVNIIFKKETWNVI